MAYKVIIPKLGTEISRAKIVNWLKKEGEYVSKGEPLFQLETSKALFEVESEYSGCVRKILYPIGTELPIMTTIAIIGKADENIAPLE